MDGPTNFREVLSSSIIPLSAPKCEISSKQNVQLNNWLSGSWLPSLFQSNLQLPLDRSNPWLVHDKGFEISQRDPVRKYVQLSRSSLLVSAVKVEYWWDTNHLNQIFQASVSTLSLYRVWRGARCVISLTNWWLTVGILPFAFYRGSSNVGRHFDLRNITMGSGPIRTTSRFSQHWYQLVSVRE